MDFVVDLSHLVLQIILVALQLRDDVVILFAQFANIIFDKYRSLGGCI